MKIVHCFFTMRTGGAQLLAIDMLNGLCLLHETTLVVINDQWDQALLQKLNRNVAVYCLNRREGSRNPLPLVQFNALLRQLEPDIIHCHERKMIQMVRYSRAKTIYTVHDVGVPADTLGQYDALIAISKSVASDVRKRAGIEADVIYNGILMDSFRRRTSYRIKANEPIRLVQVSRLMHEKKGQDVLLRAVATLVSERNCPRITLDLIGDGPSMDFLAQLAKMLQIDTMVNFRGERDRTWIANHLADYHVLVQPSRYEGFGLTVVEGLAAGLPVIASDIDGPAEIMAGLPTGTLFTSEDADACADALSAVLSAYRTAQLEAAAQETYTIVRQKFSLATVVDQYLTIYHQLLKQAVVPISHQLANPLWRFFAPQQRSA